MKYYLRCLVWLGLLFGFGQIQAQTISGQVTDETGAGLPGATVRVENTSSGAISDLDGNYQINGLNPGAHTLVFSFVGYDSQTQTVQLGTNDVVVNMQMALDSEALEEVVVIGYGTVKKEDATGAVQKVDVSDIDKGTATGADQLLAGRSAGVSITSFSGEPGAGTQLRVRGGTSLGSDFGGNNDPLIVIDGVPLKFEGFAGARNPLNVINPNDVADITILKDASAASIYGSRAANGVIIITTKKGRSGKPKLSYQGWGSLSSINDMVDVLTGDQLRDVVNQNGTTSQIDRLGDANTDWQSLVYDDAFSNSHNLTLAGGIGEDVTYRVSGRYQDQQGVLINNKIDIYTLSTSLGYLGFNDLLKFEINLTGAGTKSDFSNGDAVGGSVGFDPTKPVFNADGSYFEWLKNDGTIDEQSSRNPVALINEVTNVGKSFQGVGNFKADLILPFFTDITLSANLGFDVADGGSDNYALANTGAGGVNNGFYNRSDYDKVNKVLDLYANYKKNVPSISSDFDITAGYSYQRFERKGLDYNVTNLDATNPLNQQLAGVVDEDDPFFNERVLLSYFGRVNYIFKDKYLLTGILRRDENSNFSKDNRVGYFPAISAAWQISEEPFLSNFNVISDLKLRAGYGVVGQGDIDEYQYIPRYTLSEAQAQYQFGGGLVKLYRPEEFNPDIKWEETTTYNLGLDFGLLENRITGTIEGYYKESNDLLANIQVPAGANFSNRVVDNIGSQENRGVELTLNAYIIDNEDITWDIGLNGNYNRNEILELRDDIISVGGISGGINNNIQVLGEGFVRNAFYVFEQLYDANGDPIEGAFTDLNGDGQINNNDLYVFNHPDPDIVAGLTSSLRFKNFDASFLMRGNWDNWMYDNVSSNRATFSSIIPSNSESLNNATTDIYNTNFQAISEFNLKSDYYLQDASFVRMDNFTVGYTLDDLLKNKYGLRIFGTVENPFVITDYTGLDPEISDGIDNTIFPRARKFIFGANFDL